MPVAPLRIRNHADVVAGRRLARLLAEDRYDIVHFHTARAHAMSIFLGSRPLVRRVVTRRMDYRLRGGGYARWLYNRGADAVVAISEGVREALLALPVLGFRGCNLTIPHKQMALSIVNVGRKRSSSGFKPVGLRP